MISTDESDRAPPLPALGGSSPAWEEVHSFVLRISVNPAPGSNGAPRPKFMLEHVNQGSRQRMNSLAEVCEELAKRVNGILLDFERTSDK